MADSNLPDLYTANPVSIDPGDISYVVENTGATPAHGAFKLSQLMSNRYKISVTVAANDLVVALKHEDGTDPSADRPLYFKIGDSLRACTAALSKTLADGTNWFNSGSTTLGTKEVDYFIYAIWNTTPATDIVDLGFARVPYFSVYSEASATTTNEKYLAYANASAPTATDDMVNIGRFAATLSLTGTGHLWTVPTYTSANLIQRPIFETRQLQFAPTIAYTGGTTDPTSNVLNVNFYQFSAKLLTMVIQSTLTIGTGNRTITTYTMPWNTFNQTLMGGTGVDNITASGTKNAVASYQFTTGGETKFYLHETMAATGVIYISLVSPVT